MKNIGVALLFMLCFFAVEVQAQAHWTLDSCVRYAIANSITVKQMEVSHKMASVDLLSARAALLPNLDAGVRQNWSFGRTQTQSGLYENRTQSNTGFSVSSSMILFAGGRRINTIAKAKLDLQASLLNIEKAKNDIELQVTSLFLQVLFQKEILRIAQEQFFSTRQQVQKTQLMVESGKVSANRLSDIRSKMASDTLSIVQAAGNLRLALLDLAQSIEIQDLDSFDIVAPESFDSHYTEYPELPVYKDVSADMPQIKAAEINVESARKSLRIAQADYLPTISLNAGLSSNYFYLYQLPNVNRAFEEQLKNNLGQYIGLSLNIPIFDRLSVVGRERRAKLNIENLKLTLEKSRKQLQKEIQTAYINATVAYEKRNSAHKAVLSADEAFRNTRELYENGKLSVFDFAQSQTNLSQARANEVQAKYDYVLKMKVLEFYRR